MGKDWYTSQGYYSNPINPATGTGYYATHHGGEDDVPLKNLNFWPAPIYPVAAGKTLTISNTDRDRGKGIRVRSECDQHFIDYAKSKGILPKWYSGEVWMDTLYWHMLEVTDLDMNVTLDTPLGTTGNTGYVFAGGREVPDSQKGVPPYPGAHCHFEWLLRSPVEIFNLNKDSFGRLDPEILWAYQPQKEIMPQIKTQKKGAELRLVLQCSTMNEYQALCKILGKDPAIVEETVN